MKKLIPLLSIVLFSSFLFVARVQATSCTQEQVNTCVNGRICILFEGKYTNIGNRCGDAVGQSVIGGVTPPGSISKLNALAQKSQGSTVGIGLIIFLSRALRLFTIITGLLVIANTVVIAYMYITESDSSDVQTKVKDKLTMTVIGLVIIVGAYTLAAIVGLIFFGDARFILSPELYSALDQVP